jgi:hypothetical protein
MMISTSHARLVPPRAKYVGRVLMHVPGMLGSHCLATGEQAKESKKVKMNWLTVTSPSVTYRTMAYVRLKPATRR